MVSTAVAHSTGCFDSWSLKPSPTQRGVQTLVKNSRPLKKVLKLLPQQRLRQKGVENPFKTVAHSTRCRNFCHKRSSHSTRFSSSCHKWSPTQKGVSTLDLYNRRQLKQGVKTLGLKLSPTQQGVGTFVTPGRPLKKVLELFFSKIVAQSTRC